MTHMHHPVAVCPSIRFFQDKHVRISLFLTEGIQAPNGSFVLPSCCNNLAASGWASSSGGGGGPAVGEVALGRVRMFDASGRLECEERHPLAVLQVSYGMVVQNSRSVEALEAWNAHAFGLLPTYSSTRSPIPPIHPSMQVDPNEFFCHPVPLGDNLYDKERPKVVPLPRSYGGGAAADTENGGTLLDASRRVRLLGALGWWSSGV